MMLLFLLSPFLIIANGYLDTPCNYVSFGSPPSPTAEPTLEPTAEPTGNSTSAPTPEPTAVDDGGDGGDDGGEGRRRLMKKILMDEAPFEVDLVVRPVGDCMAINETFSYSISCTDDGDVLLSTFYSTGDCTVPAPLPTPEPTTDNSNVTTSAPTPEPTSDNGGDEDDGGDGGDGGDDQNNDNPDENDNNEDGGNDRRRLSGSMEVYLDVGMVVTVGGMDLEVTGTQCGMSDCYAEGSVYAGESCGEEGAEVAEEVALMPGACVDMSFEEASFSVMATCCEVAEDGIMVMEYEGSGCSGVAAEMNTLGSGECWMSDYLAGYSFEMDFNCSGVDESAMSLNCTAASSDDGKKGMTMSGGQIAAVVIFAILAFAATCYCVHTGKQLGGAVKDSNAGQAAPLNPDATDGYQATE